MKCNCGHLRSDHYKGTTKLSNFWQFWEVAVDKCLGCDDRQYMFHEFKADNLKYLEELSNGRE
jgi:hypothetical protein